MRDLLGESLAARLESGDRATLEDQARERKNEADESSADEANNCEWLWDASSTARSVATSVVDGGKEVRFHLEYSSGTAAVRGTKPLNEGHHFWEILMQSAVYGTDMMIGLGTAAVQMDRYRNTFCSFLGIDGESWGLSYTGLLHHGGHSRPYTSKFSQGTVIGIHLDMWRGTLTFYKDKKNLGVAYTGLQGKTFYPMVCSTAARSSMKILNAVYFPSSLQFLCCETIRGIVPKQMDVTEVMAMPPGLRNFLHNNLNWLLEPYNTASAQRRRENLDEANSLIEKVRSALEDGLDDRSCSDDDCWEGVTDACLPSEGEDHPFFKALDLSPSARWPESHHRKRSKERGSRLEKLRVADAASKDKRCSSGKTIRSSWKRTPSVTAPVSDNSVEATPDPSPRQKPEAPSNVNTEEGWSLLEMLGTTRKAGREPASTEEEDSDSRRSGREEQNSDRVNIPLSTTGEERSEANETNSKDLDTEDEVFILSDSSLIECDSPPELSGDD